METAYVVLRGSFGHFDTRGVFSSREEAAKFAREQGSEELDMYMIEEWILNTGIIGTIFDVEA